MAAIVPGCRTTRADGAKRVLTYLDSEGRYADFHSLRHLCISRVVCSGASPKVAQELARHSTVTLTLERYAHTGVYDLAAAVDGLPSMLPAGKLQSQCLAATGTDDQEISLGPFLGPRQDVLGDFLTQTDTDPGCVDKPLSSHENHGKTGTISDSTDWPRRDSNPHPAYARRDFKSRNARSTAVQSCT